jgi:putative endonuclease
MYYVYILQSLKDKAIYTGYTSNLKARLIEHQSGLVSSTKNRLPVRLVHYEAFLSETDARNQEKYLKSGGKAKNDLKNRIKNSLNS